MCAGNLIRYRYDDNSKRCVKFSYGGCGGTDNRFNSFKSCVTTCKPAADLNDMGEFRETIFYIINCQIIFQLDANFHSMLGSAKNLSTNFITTKMIRSANLSSIPVVEAMKTDSEQCSSAKRLARFMLKISNKN